MIVTIRTQLLYDNESFVVLITKHIINKLNGRSKVDIIYREVVSDSVDIINDDYDEGDGL